MKKKCFDLCVGGSRPEEAIAMAKRLGWDGVCLVWDYDAGFGKKAEEARKADGDLEVYCGARITGDNLPKKAKDAVDVADLVLVAGGPEEVNRAASESWEVDVLCHPERGITKDFTDHRNSGLDDACAKFLAERGIAVSLDFSEVLSCYGLVRASVLARMRQNAHLSKKYGFPLVLSSGAYDRYGLRSPMDLVSFGVALGLDVGHAKDAVFGNTEGLIKKSLDRSSPDVLTCGLEVVSWGDAERPRKKRRHGWY